MHFSESHKKSYWDKGEGINFPHINKNEETDVVIIGGGLAGLVTAYKLLESGKKVIVLEGNRIGRGQTIGSSAILSFVHDNIYYRLMKKYGQQAAKKYYNLQLQGFEEIKRIINKYTIDCDFRVQDFILYSQNKNESSKIEQEYYAYKKLGIEVEYTEINEINQHIEKAILIKNQATIDPYKFIVGLAKILTSKGVIIYENSFVTSNVKKNIVAVNGCEVKAKKTILTTHFPYMRFPGFYFLKMYQHRSYSVAFYSENLKLNHIYESVDKNGFELRAIGDLNLCLGESARSGKNGDQARFNEIKKYLSENFNVDEKSIKAEFSAQDCMSLDLLPYVGRCSHFKKDVFVISGFNKWGFTNSFACASELVKIMDNEKYKSLFSTRRITFIKNLRKVFEDVKDISFSFFNLVFNIDAKKLRNINNDEGAIIRKGIKRIGVYKDEEGKIYMVKAICPHLGCSLNFNQDEKTWDCPCHGSRFDINGVLLVSGPALKNLEKIEYRKKYDR